MKKWLGCAAVAVVLALPSVSAAGELRLSIANGRVTIVAQDVTVKQILDEWSRVGHTRIVGAERLPMTLITLELRDVAEGRALESLLRSAGGYIAKPRVLVPGAAATSSIDCVLIMAMSRPPAATTAAPTYNARPTPQMVMPNIVDDDVDTPSPIMPPGSVPQAPQMPMNYPGQPGQPPPATQPGQQQTLPRPGMLPQAPNVPTNPYQNPQQPIRPPGLPGVPGSGGVQNPGGPGGGGS